MIPMQHPKRSEDPEGKTTSALPTLLSPAPLHEGMTGFGSNRFGSLTIRETGFLRLCRPKWLNFPTNKDQKVFIRRTNLQSRTGHSRQGGRLLPHLGGLFRLVKQAEKQTPTQDRGPHGLWMTLFSALARICQGGMGDFVKKTSNPPK
jgi:hypothetical protein